ncbi:MAG: hypothetical protein PQJ46_14915 [Spirochaetales bacterium]|nr:hypothetical protein [Spirochaetales bacterium]
MNQIYSNDFQNFFMKVACISCIAYPVLAAIAFALHPNLLDMSIQHSTASRIAEFHNNKLMHFGHFLLVIAIPFLMVIGIHFSALIFQNRKFLSIAGLIFVILGCYILAMDKSALCFVPSALDTLSETDFKQGFTFIDAIFSLRGYLKVLKFLPLLPLGFILISIGLVSTKVIPLSHGIPILIGSILMMNPDIDLLSLLGSLSLGTGLLPYAVKQLSAN